MGSWFCDRLRLNFLAISQHLHEGRVGKKSDLFRVLFRGIWLSEQILYWKRYYFIVFEFFER